MAILKQRNDPDEPRPAASCSDVAAILDLFYAREWHGPAACANWSKDFDAFVQNEGIAEDIGIPGKPKQFDAAGDRAYVVVPATYGYMRTASPRKAQGRLRGREDRSTASSKCDATIVENFLLL